MYNVNSQVRKTCSEFDIGELCNGSTTDSDSVCWGSNPYSPARKKHLLLQVLFLMRRAYAVKRVES